MNEYEMAERNIELSAEFSRYLFEHPEVEEALPPDAEVILLPEGDPELMSANAALGHEMEAAGDQVAYVSIKKLRPKVYSRIEELELVTGTHPLAVAESREEYGA
jgi:hypothetical protein